MPDFVPAGESPRHERLRIARDLHDTFAQTLAGLGYSLDSVIADEALSARSKRDLRSIRLDLSQLLQELRDEILALRHQSDQSDPESIIEEWLSERLSVDIHWTRGEFDFEAIPARHELEYLLLELINNAIKYQGVTRVEVEESEYSLTVNFAARDRSLIQARMPGGKVSLPAFGRVGILERCIRINAQLDEAEDGFTLSWQS